MKGLDMLVRVLVYSENVAATVNEDTSLKMYIVFVAQEQTEKCVAYGKHSKCFMSD